MVETRRQKVSEDKRPTIEIEIHRCLAYVENPEERRTEGNGTMRLACESTPVDKGQNFVTSTGTLHREEMSELCGVLIETPVVEGSSTNHTIKQEESGKVATSYLFSERQKLLWELLRIYQVTRWKFSKRVTMKRKSIDLDPNGASTAQPMKTRCLRLGGKIQEIF